MKRKMLCRNFTLITIERNVDQKMALCMNIYPGDCYEEKVEKCS